MHRAVTSFLFIMLSTSCNRESRSANIRQIISFPQAGPEGRVYCVNLGASMQSLLSRINTKRLMTIGNSAKQKSCWTKKLFVI
jgi:hypothetical protein